MTAHRRIPDRSLPILLTAVMALLGCQSGRGEIAARNADAATDVDPTRTPRPPVTSTHTPTATLTPTPEPPSMENLIPIPVSVSPTGGIFEVPYDAAIYVEPASEELMAIGEYLAGKMRTATGFDIPVRALAGTAPARSIVLTTTGRDETLGAEGYELNITEIGVRLSAARPAGLFRGVQTIRQLLPPAIESVGYQPGPWRMATGIIRDYPRFEWRGVMLDVARHFFGVDDVKRYIDLAAYYKINRFHLHLTDDQGWRIEIRSWPNLTIYGGSTEVGGGEGGYYTQEEYADIAAYAAARYMILVPEIDMPGHTNAALASYPALNCDGEPPELYTEIGVGFSSLCIEREITYSFVDDVVRELAAITPGPYLHIGGDEAAATPHSDYLRFIGRVQEIVRTHGKQLIGWEEIAQADLLDGSLVQHWQNPAHAQNAMQQRAPVIMSPASRVYFDMKYDRNTELGLVWAGYVDTQTSYSWDPATQVNLVSEAAIAGVEAPLWTETVETMADIEYMVFPRLPGLAEIGWSPQARRDWFTYRQRLAAHGPRLAMMDVHFYRDPEAPWGE